MQENVRLCDKYLSRRGKQEYRDPLAEVEYSLEPFQVTSMDIKGPNCIAPRKTPILLTFIDHFIKYVEAFPIPDVSAETCARVYAIQIIARHSSGSTLITDQVRYFTSAFF
jgi:hypothetical protein